MVRGHFLLRYLRFRDRSGRDTPWAELLRRRDPIAAARLDVWLTTLRTSVGNRLLPISQEVADRWGHLGIPDPLPVADGLLAATALVHDLVLVTRNTRDVERSGVEMLNPFIRR